MTYKCLVLACLVVGALSVHDCSAQVDAPAAPAAPTAPTVPSPPAASSAPATGPGALAVEIIRQSDPRTASEILQAVQNLLNLNRPDVAGEILARWKDLQQDDRARKALVDEFGSPFLTRLATDDRLAPLGRQIAAELLEANRRVVRDPAEIARRLEELRSPDADLRAAARRALRAAGDAAAMPLLQAMVSARPSLRIEFLHALVALGVDAQPTLVAALSAPDASMRQAALDALTYVGDRDVLPLAAILLHVDPAVEVRTAAGRMLRRRLGQEPSRDEAATHVRRHLENMLEAPQQTDPIQADALSRLGHGLYQLAPTDSDARYWYVVSQLVAAQAPGEPARDLEVSQPELFEHLSQWKTDELEQMLDTMLDDERWIAAIGLIEVLGKTGTAELLMGQGGQPRPLARALTAGDRNVSVSAAQAIMRIDPAGPYPGAAQLVELAGFLARSEGTPRALVIHARMDQVGNIAGWLQTLGYATDHATDARQAELMAGAHPDYELILLSDTVGSRSWLETYQRLRRQTQARRIPLALVVRSERAADAEVVAAADRFAIAYPFPYELTTMQSIVRLTRPLAMRVLPPAEQRLQQAAQAIQWLERMSGDRPRYHFYEVLPWQDELVRALYVPALSRHAMRALGRLGTPVAQQALAEFAGEVTEPLPARQAAANAFQYATVVRGLQLSPSQIRHQYVRQREQAAWDAETQRVMNQVVDAMERQPR